MIIDEGGRGEVAGRISQLVAFDGAWVVVVPTQ